MDLEIAYIFHGTKTLVMAGVGDRDHPDGHEQTRFVLNTVHEEMGPKGGMDYNVCVAELDRPLEFNDHVQPVPLPSPEEAEDDYNQITETTILGWGKTDVDSNVEKVPRLTSAVMDVDPEIVNGGDCMRYGHYDYDDGICISRDAAPWVGDVRAPMMCDGKLCGLVGSTDVCDRHGDVVEIADMGMKVRNFIDFIHENI